MLIALQMSLEFLGQLNQNFK